MAVDAAQTAVLAETPRAVMPLLSEQRTQWLTDLCAMTCLAQVIVVATVADGGPLVITGYAGGSGRSRAEHLYTLNRDSAGNRYTFRLMRSEGTGGDMAALVIATPESLERGFRPRFCYVLPLRTINLMVAGSPLP